VLRRRSLFAACLAAAVLIISGVATAAASAQTVRGRILGEPAVSGAHAQVPLALSGGGIAVLTVPAKSGFRTVTTGRTSADHTRLGDLVSAQVRSLVRGRAKSRYLKIVSRSQAPSFFTLHGLLSGAQTGARAASAAVATIAQQEAAGNGTVSDPDALRNTMLAFRSTLNNLVNGLRDQADNIDKVRGSVSVSKALVRQLTDTAGAARTTARKLDDGVTGLDEFINSIGGLSADGLPIGGVGEVSQVLAAALQLIDGLDPQDGLPGGPTLPDPLGGVQVPQLPPVLPG
jgi:hypothetical protein